MIRINKKQNDFNKTDIELIQKLKDLPCDFWDFRNVNASDGIHGVHTYPAVMVYPISRNILNIMKDLIKIENFLDPFEGSGTTLAEGINAGIENIYGNDLNPLANLITKVKTTIMTDKDFLELEKIKQELNNHYNSYKKYVNTINDDIKNEYGIDYTSKDGWGSEAPKYIEEYYKKNNIKLKIPDYKNIGYWFKAKPIIELCIIKDYLDKIDNKNIKNLLLVALSETTRIVSNRRNGEFKMYRMPPEKVEKFDINTKEKFDEILENYESKVKEFSKYNKNKKISVNLLNEDTRILNGVPDNKIDIVITSPPYGDSKTTVAYGEFSRLSLEIIGLKDLSEETIKSIDRKLMGGEKIKIDDNFNSTINSKTFLKSFKIITEKDNKRAGDVYSFYRDLEFTIKSVSSKLKSGGYQFWVVGNRIVKEEKLNTDDIIAEIGEKYGQEYIGTIERNIINKVMPSKNSPTNETGKKVSTMTTESIVIMRKK